MGGWHATFPNFSAANNEEVSGLQKLKRGVTDDGRSAEFLLNSALVEWSEGVYVKMATLQAAAACSNVAKLSCNDVLSSRNSNALASRAKFSTELRLSSVSSFSQSTIELHNSWTVSHGARELLPGKVAASAGEHQNGDASGNGHPEGEGFSVGRRESLIGVAALVAGALSTNSPALAAKAPKGYSAILDNADGYAFFYPFGWQEVAVKGQDVALKDVIEPLESVSVSIIKTDKATLQELGSPEEVAKALVEKVLSSPTQKVSLVSAKEKTENDRTYYQFEFVAKAKNFTRHALGAVAIKDGKFYTLTTGANERRWTKMEEKLRTVVDSFTTL
ncbi:hypothetical protein R1flu_012320 [Riccia fluitans]|uniref:PsbP C-terminal domain-containing protein n=1 Tax=Riccia fluitans TaxID=41844 RepID=A0ABD1ZBF3_9MARC